MRRSLRPNAFVRMMENRFTKHGENFVDMAWWDEMHRPPRPVMADADMPVWIGVDASVKRNSAPPSPWVPWDRHGQACPPRQSPHFPTLGRPA